MLSSPYTRVAVEWLHEIVGGDIGAGDDRLDDRLAVLALAHARRVEGLGRLVEGKAMRNERFEVDLALRDERDRERVVAGLVVPSQLCERSEEETFRRGEGGGAR